MRILITNDDGINSPGLKALKKIACTLSNDIWIIAPEDDKSGASHSLTLSNPLRLNKINNKTFSLRGTPTDCILIGIYKILKNKPDLILSGINRGLNIAEDVNYSGTLAGAREGCILGINSIAISQSYNKNIKNEDLYNNVISYAPNILQKLLKILHLKYIMLNINFPDCKLNQIKGIKITAQGHYENSGLIVDERYDLRQKLYYWLGFRDRGVSLRDNSDINAILNNFISITPLKIDYTDYNIFYKLNKLF